MNRTEEPPDFEVVFVEMVELHRAWNWLAYGYFSGEIDERPTRAVISKKGVFVTNTFDDEQAYEALGRIYLARDLIGSAVESGRLDLYGVRTGAGRKGDNESWEKIEPGFMSGAGFEGWDFEITLIGDTAEYERLYVSWKGLQALFPYWGSEIATENSAVAEMNTSAADPITRPTVAAETGCAKLITDLSKEAGNNPSKREVWGLAQAQFGEKLSYKAFVRAWDRSAPEKWKRPGRKRSINALPSS